MKTFRNRMQPSKALLATACALIFGLVLTAPAMAAGGGEGETSIFAGDLGNVLWTLVIFGLVLFVLGKFAWGPLLEVLQKREDFIRDSLESAKKDRDASEARLAEYEQRLVEARAEATAIVEEGRRDAEVLRQRIEQEAQAESDKSVARAKREIAIAHETAVKDLYELSGRLATEIAGRIVGRELSAGDHERLIRDSIEEIGRLESN